MERDFDNKHKMGGIIELISDCIDRNDSIGYSLALSNLVQGFSPVICAISIGDLESVIKLKEELGEKIHGSNIEDAAFYGHLGIIQYIESTRTISKIEYSNALYHAWNKRHLDIVKYLVSKGVTNVLCEDSIKKMD